MSYYNAPTIISTRLNNLGTSRRKYDEPIVFWSATLYLCLFLLFSHLSSAITVRFYMPSDSSPEFPYGNLFPVLTDADSALKESRKEFLEYTRS
jgi:hypothetical protein